MKYYPHTLLKLTPDGKYSVEVSESQKPVRLENEYMNVTTSERKGAFYLKKLEEWESTCKTFEMSYEEAMKVYARFALLDNEKDTNPEFTFLNSLKKGIAIDFIGILDGKAVCRVPEDKWQLFYNEVKPLLIKYHLDTLDCAALFKVIKEEGGYNPPIKKIVI